VQPAAAKPFRSFSLGRWDKASFPFPAFTKGGLLKTLQLRLGDFSASRFTEVNVKVEKYA
jgi:hypothetical protein